MRAILHALGWSQAKLARKLGIRPTAVSRWTSVPDYAVAYLSLAAAIQRLWHEADAD